MVVVYMLIIEQVLEEEYWRTVETIRFVSNQLASMPNGTIRRLQKNGREITYFVSQEDNKLVFRPIPSKKVAHTIKKLHYRNTMLNVLANQEKTQKIAVRALGRVPHDNPYDHFNHQERG